MSASRREPLATGAEDLGSYISGLMPSFELTRHHRLLLAKLELIERGALSRLIVCLPPQNGKSLVTSWFFPSWYLGRGPHRHVIFGTYGQELADDFGRNVRNTIADPLHRAIFPACKMAQDSQAAHRFATTTGGTYFAVGRGGSATGRPADLVIIDDPLSGFAEAHSEAVRRELHAWFATDILSRLSPRGALIVCGTRWHQDDLAGRLLQGNAGQWDSLILPALAEEDDPLGREPGEPLWPERYSAAWLAQRKQDMDMSSALWSSLYQQRPVPVEGSLFKIHWWRRYSAPPPSFSRVVIAFDTAFSAKTAADFSAAVVIGETSTGFYVLDAWRGKVEFPELKRIALELAGKWKPHALLIESRASGQSLIQEFQRTTSLPVLAVPATADKLTRAASVTPMVEAGRVFLPMSAEWLDPYLQEISDFPATKHDDWVDATVHALAWLRGDKSNQPGPLVFIGPTNSRAEQIRRYY